jgi:hypothetical protein
MLGLTKTSRREESCRSISTSINKTLKTTILKISKARCALAATIMTTTWAAPAVRAQTRRSSSNSRRSSSRCKRPSKPRTRRIAELEKSKARNRRHRIR